MKLFRLGEKAVLVRSGQQIEEEEIRALSEIIMQQKPRDLEDVITAYDSIAITFSRPIVDIEGLREYLNNIKADSTSIREPELIEIPVCYGMGMDWNEIEQYTGLSQSEVIRIHSNARYEVAMLGFVPGFIYLSGLPETLFCPRKKVPRIAVPAGSVGIGGEHTGMYSLSSPGGWQIIGLSPVKLFNEKEEPPVKLKAGDQISFIPISEKEYHKRINNES